MKPLSLGETQRIRQPAPSGDGEPHPQRDREPNVLEEQVRLVYAHFFPGLAATMVNASLLVFIQWDFIPRRTLLAWLAYMVVVMAVRTILTRRYRTAAPQGNGSHRWGRWYTWGAAATGIGWGLSGIFLVPGASVPHQFFTTFLLSGMAAGAMTTLSPIYSAYCLYLVPTVIPIAVVFLTYGDTLHTVAGGIAVLFMLFLLKAGRTQNRFIRAWILLNMEKSDLIEHLAHQKEHVEELNRSLTREIAVRMEAEKALQYRLTFESLLTSISTGFINLPPEQIDQGIQDALGQVGTFAGVDCSYIFLFDASRATANKTHEWRAEEIAPAYEQLQGLRVEDFPWWMERLNRLESIHIPRVADLPSTAESERRLLLSQSVQSVVVVPLVSGASLMGFLGFSSIHREKNWDTTTVTLLRIVAEMFVNALERKRTHGELERARQLAEAAARAKSQFLANMSHEIRTPMHGVLGMLEMLRDGSLSPSERTYADLAHYSAKTLLGIIDDILDFSKIEAGRMILESTRFDLPAVFAEALDLLRESAAGKGLTLISSVPDVVPRHVYGDPVRLRQVLINLIGNAVKFTDRGGVAVEVIVESRPPGRVCLRFAVRDTGIGIPVENQRYLFDPFTQADNSMTRRFGGTGLGLAISKQLVELMGGEIGLESAPGRGSTFWFRVCLGVSPGPLEP